MSSIYLVRHAQSHANVDNLVLRKNTNMGIDLTDIGREQILEAGKFLSTHFLNKEPVPLNLMTHLTPKIKVWNSPYDRTRKTAQAIKDELAANGLQYVEEENIHIAERQLGIIDEHEDYENSYPAEFNHYQLHRTAKQEFFVRPPLGESAFDMCLRLDFFLKNYVEKESQYEHIVVTHGACVRGLIMLLTKDTYESYSKMNNPHNASIHYIENHKNKGLIFEPNNITG